MSSFEKSRKVSIKALDVLIDFIDTLYSPFFGKFQFSQKRSFETIIVRKIRETKKALFVESLGKDNIWLPKSQIKEILKEGDILTISIPEWLFDEKFK